MNDVFWPLSTVGSPHSLIVGIPGQGKSVTARNIAREVNLAGCSILAIDFHGDFTTSLEGTFNFVNVGQDGMPFSPFEVKPGAHNAEKSAALEIADIFRTVAGLGEIQRANTYKALLNCYAAHGWASGVEGDELPTISEFVSELNDLEKKTKGNNTAARLIDITEFDLFREGSHAREFDPFEKSGSIYDVSAMGSEAVKLAAVGFLLRKIYNSMFSWGQSGKIRLVLLLDEAHLLSKDPTIPKLMKEGRKFGISVILISQSLDDFKPEVIENAGLRVAFRTNHPASKKVAAVLGGGNAPQLVQRLENLNVGQALVAIPGSSAPVLVQMNS